MPERLDPPTRRNLKKLPGRFGPDVMLLLLTNLAVILLAWFQEWKLAPLIWIYWWQNIIIGFFNWRRIKKLSRFSTSGLKINDRLVEPNAKTKKWVAGFFVLHYGGFHFIYLIFILGTAEGLLLPEIVSASVGIALFLLNHWFSYRYNLRQDLAATPSLGGMAFYPYARVIPMHLVIIIGLQLGSASRAALIFFLVLKTMADLIMHLVKHFHRNEATA
jgi:hypothetical protein